MRQAQNPGPPNQGGTGGRDGGKTFSNTFIISHNGSAPAMDLIFGGLDRELLAGIMATR